MNNPKALRNAVALAYQGGGTAPKVVAAGRKVDRCTDRGGAVQ